MLKVVADSLTNPQILQQELTRLLMEREVLNKTKKELETVITDLNRVHVLIAAMESALEVYQESKRVTRYERTNG